MKPRMQVNIIERGFISAGQNNGNSSRRRRARKFYAARVTNPTCASNVTLQLWAHVAHADRARRAANCAIATAGAPSGQNVLSLQSGGAAGATEKNLIVAERLLEAGRIDDV